MKNIDGDDGYGAICMGINGYGCLCGCNECEGYGWTSMDMDACGCTCVDMDGYEKSDGYD